MGDKEHDNFVAERILLEYSCSSRRLIMLDYDGTLVPFKADPDDAYPGSVLLGLLYRLSTDSRNDVAVLSGRMKDDMDRYLGKVPLSLSAEHGLWIRQRGGEWERLLTPETDWLPEAERIVWVAMGFARGSSIERKTSSVSFHYRSCDEAEASQAIGYIRNTVAEKLKGRVSVLYGNKVIEIRSPHVDKGFAAQTLMSQGEYDFILCCGDDTTDEDMFSVLPQHAIAVKVGEGDTVAENRVSSVEDIRRLLLKLTESDSRTVAGGSQ